MSYWYARTRSAPYPVIPEQGAWAERHGYDIRSAMDLAYADGVHKAGVLIRRACNARIRRIDAALRRNSGSAGRLYWRARQEVAA